MTIFKLHSLTTPTNSTVNSTTTTNSTKSGKLPVAVCQTATGTANCSLLLDCVSVILGWKLNFRLFNFSGRLPVIDMSGPVCVSLLVCLCNQCFDNDIDC